jgi:hypothetical protein
LADERRKIDRKMVKLESLPDGRLLPNNTVLVLRVRFERNPKIYTYLALKVGGRWFFTGRGPHDAGWGAVERWMIADDKTVVSAWTYHLYSDGELSTTEPFPRARQVARKHYGTPSVPYDDTDRIYGEEGIEY